MSMGQQLRRTIAKSAGAGEDNSHWISVQMVFEHFWTPLRALSPRSTKSGHNLIAWSMCDSSANRRWACSNLAVHSLKESGTKRCAGACEHPSTSSARGPPRAYTCTGVCSPPTARKMGVHKHLSRPPHHARRMFGYRDESLSSRYNSKFVTTGYYGFLRTALSHPCNHWVCVRHVHSLWSTQLSASHHALKYSRHSKAGSDFNPFSVHVKRMSLIICEIFMSVCLTSALGT